MRSRWLLTAVVLLAGLATADGAISSLTVEDLYDRPVTLVRGDWRWPVWLPVDSTATQPEGTAKPAGAAAVRFGQTYVFETPNGTRISCEHKLFWMWCEGGWEVERGDS